MSMTTSPSQPTAPSLSGHAPVWMPTPGVPLVARLLTYAFWAALLLAVCLTVTWVRPPDRPPLRTHWTTMALTDTLQLAHPADWAVITQRQQNLSMLSVALVPGSAVRVETWVFAAPVAQTLDARDALLGRYTDYASTALIDDLPAATIAMRFAFRDSSLFGQTIPQAGAWALQSYPTATVLMIATAPQASWAETEPIFRRMLSSVAQPTPPSPAPDGAMSP